MLSNKPQSTKTQGHVGNMETSTPRQHQLTCRHKGQQRDSTETRHTDDMETTHKHACRQHRHNMMFETGTQRHTEKT